MRTGCEKADQFYASIAYANHMSEHCARLSLFSLGLARPPIFIHAGFIRLTLAQ